METLLPSEIVLPFIGTVAIGIFVLVGAFAIQQLRQAGADVMRETYELSFPAEMNMASVHGALHALSGLDKPGLLGPVYPVTFERYVKGTGDERYFAHLPGHMHERVEQWLEEHLGVSIDVVPREEDPVRNAQWQSAVELTVGSGSLDIVDPVVQSATVGARFKHMAEGEELLTQWIFFPAKRQHPTPETKDKLSSNTFNAIARIAACGEKPETMVTDLLSAYKALDNEGAFFRHRAAWGVADSIRRRSAGREFPIFVNETELATCIGWPLGGSTVIRARRIPPTAAHDTAGVVLGESNSSRARGRRIAVPQDGMFRHGYVIGGTGTGKSRELENVTLEAINRGMAVFVIEPDGGLVDRIANRIPRDRVKDTIKLDPTDRLWPVGINVMSGDDPERTRSHIVGMMHSIQPDAWGTRLERILGNAAYTVALNKGTFYDLWPMLTNKHYRSEQLKKISRQRYPVVHEEWAWIDGIADMAVDSAVNRLNSLIGYEKVRNVVAQQEGLNFDQLIQDHKILLVSLPIGRIGLAGAKALGQLVFELAWDAAIKVPEGQRQPSLVVADEFQHFSSYASLAARFSEGRKYQQSYWIAHQYLGQIDGDVLEAIKMNVQNPMAFRLAPDDAKKIAPVFPPMKPEEISALQTRHAVARIYGSQGYSPTVTLKTLDSPPATGSHGWVIENTRRNYAKPLAQVEAEIFAKHKGPEPRRKPIIGSLEDD